MVEKTYRIDVAIDQQDFDPDNRIAEEDVYLTKGINELYPEICHNLEVLVQKEFRSFPAFTKVDGVLPLAIQFKNKSTGWPVVNVLIRAQNEQAIRDLMHEIGYEHAE